MKRLLTISRWASGVLLRKRLLGLLGMPWLLALGAAAQPVLRCDVTYAGATQTVEARPVADPYPVRAVDIGGRFRFKPVLVRAADGTLDRAVVQVYVHTPEQPVTIQVVTWPQPRPSAAADGPAALSGWQHLYAGPLERELIYGCALREAAP
ncbi:hypothetical protein [Tibeticola sp.]|uniref:hypothetical protein n=1 Tax=Tibeticola sp. TaxID=2005368 RepID=UPI0025FFA4A1|nr:hypothetical protein [Tibeticola sp.]